MADEQGAVHATAASAPARRGKLLVFISYSRDDLDFADQLDIALRLIAPVDQWSGIGAASERNPNDSKGKTPYLT
jgi:hypothetical protein